MLNVVIFNGGRGAESLIPELLKIKNTKIFSIVNAFDDGKSTGEIRFFFDMLGPSDLRKVQKLFLPKQSEYYFNYNALFEYRFPKKISRERAIYIISSFYNKNNNALNLKFEKKINILIKESLKKFLEYLLISEKIKNKKLIFSDCSLMNCVYAGLYIINNKNFSKTIQKINKVFKLDGEVISSSLENYKLSAIRENGQYLSRESEIVERRSNIRIKNIFLMNEYLDKKIVNGVESKKRLKYLEQSNSKLISNYEANKKIKKANIIIYAPGTQHSSLYPTYILSGIGESIAKNKKALKFFITNIGADYETPSYRASEYILGALNYINRYSIKKNNYKINDFFDYNFVNLNNKNSNNFVKIDKNNLKKIDTKTIYGKYSLNDSTGKHDGKKIIKKLFELYFKIK